MVTVQRGNVILQVNDDAVDRMVDKGFNVIDESGTVIREAIPTDTNTLRRAYTEHKEEIARLESEIEVLKRKLATLSEQSIEKKSSTRKASSK